MRIEDVQELHHITRMLNVASIMRQGLLSPETGLEYSTRSFGTTSIGSSRWREKSPTGIPLTRYVHLLVNARGPMWQKHLRRLPIDAVNHAIFRVTPNVLRLPGTYVSAWGREDDRRVFLSPEEALRNLFPPMLEARWWANDKEAERQLMTHVIVPDRISPESLLGVYVAHSFLVPQLQKIWPSLRVEVNRSLFFADTMEEVQRELCRSERSRSGLFNRVSDISEQEGNYLRLMHGEDPSSISPDEDFEGLGGTLEWDTRHASTFDWWTDDETDY